MTESKVDYRYGDIPNIENLKKELTAMLSKYGVIGKDNYDVGQVIVHVNASKVAGVSKNNWKIV